jgi:V-type H+-transporting ATPase subunit a
VYLIFMKDHIDPKSMIKAAVPARYLLLMMGMCAMYNGAIYNDFLSIPLNIFGSNWENNVQSKPYPFGLDPEWHESEFNLLFFNSFKMKISVIFGVIQMIVGTLFRGSNTIQFRNPVDFFFEFIPQLVFMLSIFGYMILMIFIKWSIDWDYNHEDVAPNLITVLMNMFLRFGALDDQGPLWDDRSG